MANIFALLVGINRYPRMPLQGCINDVKAFRDYLTGIYGNLPSMKLHIRELTDESPIPPSKENIIAAFDHFNAAGDKDICLFYFSGHGSFAPAPPEFARESTGYFQSFVCADSRLPGGTDLVDKEMGALIWKVTTERPGIHFIAITDCCHSGTITKGIDNTGIRDRMLTGSPEYFPAAPEKYFGSGLTINGLDAFEKEEADGGIIAAGAGLIRVRQGRHIHLAASRDSQTSKELSIDGMVRGAFTHSLLKTLYSCGGRISYENLIATAGAYVKNLVPDQTPDFNINGDPGDTTGRNTFLTGEPFRADPKYLVYHNPANGWCIKAGLLQQVSKGDRVIIDNKCTTSIADNPEADVSVIIGKPALGATSNTYHARMQRTPERLLKLSFEPGFPGHMRDMLTTEYNAHPSTLIDFPAGMTGQYIIRTNTAGKVFISLPGSDRAVFEPLEVGNAGEAAWFLDRIAIVSNWVHLLEFSNPLPGLTRENYSIGIRRSVLPANYNPQTFEEVKDRSQPIDLSYKQWGKDWYLPAFQLTITNHSGVPLWITNAYLEFDYGITTNYFAEFELAAKTSSLLTFIKKGLPQSVVKMKVDDKYRELGYTEIIEHLKLFISTEKIDTRSMQQGGVNLPAVINRAVFKSPTDRSPTDEENDNGAPSQAWIVETITFRTIRSADTVEIGPEKPARTGGIIISHDSGFTAQAAIAGSDVLMRSADHVPPPYAVAHNSYLEPFDLMTGARSGMHTDVLELFDAKNTAAVTPANPLMIEVTAGLPPEGPPVIPVGYDKETGLYYPLGYVNPDGRIVIETLPEETASDEAISYRSFKGSIKIYFQKVIGQKTGRHYDYPRLASVCVNDQLEVKYQADVAKVGDAVREARSILLFIHGIIGDTESMVKCIKTPLAGNGKTLEDTWDLVLAFDYENLNTLIQTTAGDLEKRLIDVGLRPGHDKHFVIAAHSMGGLVSRWMIEKGKGRQIVSKLVMLGTPNNGSAWADVQDMAGTLLTFALNGAAFLKPWMFLLSGVGRLIKGTQVTLAQMNPETGIYDDLNTGTDPGIPYIIVAGNTQEIIADYGKTKSLLQRLFIKIKKRAVYDALDALLFGKANDIAVSDESITILKGSGGWENKPLVFPVASDHLNYFVTTAALIRI